EELEATAEALINGSDLLADARTASHAEWAEAVKASHPEMNKENVMEILQLETGKVFSEVLEDAGVFKRDAEGNRAFMRFIDTL
ncbi:MAG: galactose-1-phosphate uridylyltransferase, partial [Lachnospiraceae bacterium]|nr:galactose-1-phosphate uridylyltransferase [Lachnospiraceae bacterium]